MIAITIALIILASMSWIFVGNSRARAETERENQQIENGSYAMQSLTFDLQMAGYWAEYNIGLAISSGAVATPLALPDPCDTSLATLVSAMPLGVQGYYQGAAGLGCISDLRPNNDVIVVRRASGCVAGTANCAPAPAATGGGKTYFQASLCDSSAELESVLQPADQFRMNPVGTKLDRHKKDCTALAEIHEVITHIYYVANNDQPNDGIPTLKRAEMDPTSPTGWTDVPIAQGVENMHFEYGIDIDGDRVPDTFQADPINYTPGAPGCTAVPCVANFQNTTAVSVHLLVRNPTATPGYADSKSYSLGLAADGSVYTLAPTDPTYRRHVYTGVVRLINPSIR